MEYTNAHKLSAIVAKWLEPMAGQLAGMRLSAIPALSGIENKIRSTGWVSPSYSIANDLSPIMGRVANALVQPFVYGMIKDIPDETIPTMFKEIVRAAIDNGGMSILEGTITFSLEDMERLNHLLDRNLPCETESFTVED